LKKLSRTRSAFRYRIKVFKQYSGLIRELVTRDLKLKYRRSFLGYIWSVLNPLLIMIVMTVVFSAMFRKNIENYPVYLLIGRTMYDFTATSTKQALKSVTGNAALLKKTYIPKYIFTLSKVTTNLVETAFSMGALLIVMLATRSPFYWYMLLIPMILIEAYIFSLGLGFLLAMLNVFFRDIEYIYRAVTVAWMYLTPLFYPIERLPVRLQQAIKLCNPLYYYIAQFRDVALYGQLPGPRIVIGGWVIALAMLAIGLFAFQRKQDKFILHI